MSNVTIWEAPNFIPPKLQAAYYEFCNDPNRHHSEYMHITDWLCITFGCKTVYHKAGTIRGFQFKSPEELTAFLIVWIT